MSEGLCFRMPLASVHLLAVPTSQHLSVEHEGFVVRIKNVPFDLDVE